MRVRKKLGVCYVLMVLLTIAIVIPIIWLVFISMKPNSEITVSYTHLTLPTIA